MLDGFNLEDDFDIKDEEKDMEQLGDVYNPQDDNLNPLSQEDSIVLPKEEDWIDGLSKEELENAKSLISDMDKQIEGENFLEGLSDEEINEIVLDISDDENKIR